MSGVTIANDSADILLIERVVDPLISGQYATWNRFAQTGGQPNSSAHGSEPPGSAALGASFTP